MANIATLIIVEAGIVSEVFSNHDGNIMIIDRDCLENGDCPICGEELAFDECEIDWNAVSDNDLADMFLERIDGNNTKDCTQ